MKKKTRVARPDDYRITIRFPREVVKKIGDKRQLLSINAFVVKAVEEYASK